ncbi:protein of unknown function [Desulfacinum infernum DSM 9756]|uniref:Flavinylation-associated cytochrome domain-containing protein n=1 Tax=Desulfacinum infernum DSM 9756 TaxID=1121391 RepID=A0A1M5I018_9BACT|nr:DUF4405 domain-containing protein [Desulfacinum infernum]SHG21555.1 protein of unknown function [Desulfacinum infernum DSM 9756]
MKLRRITSLTAMLAFFGILVTSVVLYIVPQGRVAYWSNWRLLGLDKTQWSQIHLNLGVLFLLAGALHIYYNWSAITAYLKDRARRLRIFTADFNAALLVTALVVAGTLAAVPPLSWIPAGSDYFQMKAEARYGIPPYGHAELSSLSSFAAKVGLNLEESLRRLQAKGFVGVSPEATLKDMAVLNGVSPQGLYLAMKPEMPIARPTKGLPENPPAGLGRLSLQDLAATYGVPLDKILGVLREAGYAAGPSSTLKALAEGHDRTPPDLYQMLRRKVSGS